MIAFLKGTIYSKQDGACIVDVSGVGYEVSMPVSELDRLPPTGEPVTLYTWYLGRDDGVQLFGFLSAENRALFKLLLGISGVGPKSALAILSGVSKEELSQVVARQDVQALSRLPGIGRKTAERLLLELKDKLKVEVFAGPVVSSVAGDYGEALEALLARGYPTGQARAALQKVADQAQPAAAGTDRAADIVRRALRHL